MTGTNETMTETNESATMADLDSYESSFRNIRVGEYVQGKIEKIDSEGILVDLGGKTDGFIPANEISDNNGNSTSALKVGDLIDAVVIHKKGGEGEILLSKKRADRELSWKRLIDAFEKGEIITATCTEAVKGGIICDVGVRGFVPASHVDVRPIRDLTELLGEEMRLKILEIDQSKKKVVLSRKAVLESERESSREKVFSSIKEGDIVKGRVERLTPFGAFVNLGGIDGLIHISELSWKRVATPAEAVSVGDMVDVLVLKIDKENNKISLSLRQAKADPWLVAEEKFPVASLQEGTVTKLAKNYAFIELMDGIEGLIPLSEISQERISKPEDKLTLGEKVTVRILEVKGKDRRMLLSMREPRELRVKEAPAKKKEEYEDYVSTKSSSFTIGDMLRSKAADLTVEIEPNIANQLAGTGAISGLPVTHAFVPAQGAADSVPVAELTPGYSDEKEFSPAPVMNDVVAPTIQPTHNPVQPVKEALPAGNLSASSPSQAVKVTAPASWNPADKTEPVAVISSNLVNPKGEPRPEIKTEIKEDK